MSLLHLQRYVSDGGWRNATVAQAAEQLATKTPGCEVFVGAGASPGAGYTAERGYLDAEALAASLTDLGIRQGDVVSFQAPNWPETATINLACALVGALVTPIVPIFRDAEVAQMLADSKSRLHFSATAFRNFDYRAMLDRIGDQAPSLRSIVYVRGESGASSFQALLENGRGRRLAMAKVDPESPKLLLYTSGTTGRPKGVMHNHNTLTRFLDSCARHWRVRPGEPILMPSPVTHVTGYGFGLEMPFLVGTRTVLMESWDAGVALELIDRHGVVGTVSATPFLQELVDIAQRNSADLPTLRFFGCGGAAVSPDLVRRANSIFRQSPAFRVFGCSEAPMISLGYLGPERAELAATTDGEVVDYEVKIVDEQGADVPRGTPGEILVRGPAMFMGYADAAQTRESITEDGFFRTGDIGTLSDDNAVLVTARKKDLIIRGGENISPKEIEDVLHRHPSIAEAAVVSMPHPRLGEGVCAFVVQRDTAQLSLHELNEWIGANGLARQKCPERLEVVEQLPKTASGKVRKDVLREKVRAALSSQPGA